MDIQHEVDCDMNATHSTRPGLLLRRNDTTSSKNPLIGAELIPNNKTINIFLHYRVDSIR